MIKKVKEYWNNNTRHIGYAIILMSLVFFASSCADATNVETCLPGDPYGFFGGLWHGFIAFFSWIGSLFSDDIAIYAVNNNGGWYDFGFVLGSGILGFGASKSTNSKK